MSVKLECFYPNENINEYVPDDVFRFYHFNYMNKQVVIVHNKYGYSVRCLNFAPSFFNGKQKYNTWYQVSEYFHELETAVFFFNVCVCDLIFGFKGVVYQHVLGGLALWSRSPFYCFSKESDNVL